MKSKAGRSKGMFLVAVQVDGNRAYVCDGKYYPAERPKLKNIKHLSVTKTVVRLPKTNRQLRQLLREFTAD